MTHLRSCLAAFEPAGRWACWDLRHFISGRPHWLPFIVLFALWLRPSRKRGAFAIGFFWGLGLFLAGVSWIYVSLNVYVATCLRYSPASRRSVSARTSLLFPALGGVAFQWIRQRRHETATGATAFDLLLAMPACFVASEMLRGWFLSGFPWLTMGYSQTPGGVLPAPLAGFAPLLGVFGISWLMALIAALGVLSVPRVAGSAVTARHAGRHCRHDRFVRFRRRLATCTVECASRSDNPGVASSKATSSKALKWREDQRVPTLTNYLELAEQSSAKLVVMPETALPTFWMQCRRIIWSTCVPTPLHAGPISSSVRPSRNAMQKRPPRRIAISTVRFHWRFLVAAIRQIAPRCIR